MIGYKSRIGGWKYEIIILKTTSSISFEITLWWIPQNLTVTLVQIGLGNGLVQASITWNNVNHFFLSKYGAKKQNKIN